MDVDRVASDLHDLSPDELATVAAVMAQFHRTMDSTWHAASEPTADPYRAGERAARAQYLALAPSRAAERLADELPGEFTADVRGALSEAQALAHLVFRLTDDWRQLTGQLETLMWRANQGVSETPFGDVCEALGLNALLDILVGMAEYIGERTGCRATEPERTIERAERHAADLVNEEGWPYVVWNESTLAVAAEHIARRR